MVFLLSAKNVFDYLSDKGFCTPAESKAGKIESKVAKNFNLLITFPDDSQILVKQEPHDREGRSQKEFVREWCIQELVAQFPEVDNWRAWLPSIPFFDEENSILIVDYLKDYRNLGEFYGKENEYPVPIAASMGAMLAAFHRPTLDSQKFKNFLLQDSQTTIYDPAANTLHDLNRVEPEIFGQVPSDGLKFLVLYQRYDSLGKALAELSGAIEPCCLAHNDLKLNNILIPENWENSISSETNTVPLKLIDWERSCWGDPSFDLGMLVGSYLTLWLSSLVVSKSISIDEALTMAMTPLEKIKPSLYALITSYLNNFPEILDRRPDFLKRVIQFAGLALIQVIQSNLQYQKSFNNTGVCMLQVAKSLLCRPEASVKTIFGFEEKVLSRVGNG
jgi:Phosphotransferase enzyme family